MGSLGHVPDTDEIVVLVTGFAPFTNRFPVNPSWEIASRLPNSIPLVDGSKESAGSDAALIPSLSAQNIRIIVHPEPIKVSYAAVRELVPKIWESHAKIDYMIHVGMASGRSFYSIERRAHRTGYGMGDVDGVVLGDEHERAEKEGKDWIWEDCPDELLSDVDIDDVWRRWRKARPGNDVRISEDAGRYLCDFIYYSSLARLWKEERERKVVFFHVPVDSEPRDIMLGKNILVELIRSIVLSGMTKKITLR